MVQLVMRFYDVLEGSVTLDGTDIRQLNIQCAPDVDGHSPERTSDRSSCSPLIAGLLHIPRCVLCARARRRTEDFAYECAAGGSAARSAWCHRSRCA